MRGVVLFLALLGTTIAAYEPASAEDSAAAKVVDGQLDLANKGLLAAEAELLRKLQEQDKKDAAEEAPAAPEPVAVAEEHSSADDENHALENLRAGAKPEKKVRPALEEFEDESDPIPAGLDNGTLPIDPERLEPRQAQVREPAHGETVSTAGPPIGDPVTKQFAELDAKQQKLASQVSEQSKSLTSLKTAKQQLEQQVQRAEARIAELTKQLEEKKNQLIYAETEVERLSGVLEARNKSTLARYGSPRVPVQSPQVAEKIASDMPIATITVPKANLRTGPGKDNSPLMTVSEGTRLVVETRLGPWYRVVTPTGARAWVSSDVVSFGSNSQASPSQTVKIKGYDSSLEAFDTVEKPVTN